MSYPQLSTIHNGEIFIPMGKTGDNLKNQWGKLLVIHIDNFIKYALYKAKYRLIHIFPNQK